MDRREFLTMGAVIGVGGAAGSLAVAHTTPWPHVHPANGEPIDTSKMLMRKIP
jgi:hypothetical protein